MESNVKRWFEHLTTQFHDWPRSPTLARRPEILDEDVSDPIVITGLPRTGTSKLQRMMSADPTVQRLLVWRGVAFALQEDPCDLRPR